MTSTPDVEGKKKKAKLTRNTNTTIDDAPEASRDETGRQYQEGFETVNDRRQSHDEGEANLGHVTRMVPTEFGYRIEPVSRVWNVYKEGQNFLPGEDDALVPQGTLDELKEADKDYPDLHREKEPSEPVPATVDRHDYFRSNVT
jgi:hypothetical protein